MSRKRLDAILKQRRAAREENAARVAAVSTGPSEKAGYAIAEVEESDTPTVMHRSRPRRHNLRRRARKLYVPTELIAGKADILHPLLPDSAPSDVKVSIVFGTYNRIGLLQGCVASIRRAARSLPYEIVVCDGGSTDGSVQWLQEQPDVIYIAGDLSGAVPAFNAAARRATGEFVLALNDDATLEPDAIVNGLRHFADRFVGQVAMSFCENEVWKIEAVHNRIYANFALTRMNIVRAVEQIVGGMWSTCYRTYGGDTEFSCLVYRLGYKVVEAKDARVVHQEYVDHLRHKNLRFDRQRHQFHERWPDGACLNFRGPAPRLSGGEMQALVKAEQGEGLPERWPRIASADPVIGQHPPRAPLKQERVLHWQLWTTDDPQTSMVRGLLRLGAAGHECIRWTDLEEHKRGHVFVNVVRARRPSLVFLQCQDPHAIPVDALRQIRDDPQRDPSMVVCVWSGDIGPGKGPWVGSGDEWQYQLASAVDLMLFTGTGQVEHHRARGMANAAYLQIGYDVDRYFPGSPGSGGHMLTFMGQDYGAHFDGVPGSESHLRRSAVAALRSIEGFVPYGGGFGKPMAQVDSGNVYRASTMALSLSLTSNLGRYTSDRLLRIMACACPALVKRFADMEGMGLIDGENCIGWDTTAELVDVAQHWLDPSRRAALRDLGRQGADLMKKHHTWDIRMQELQAIVNAVRGQR